MRKLLSLIFILACIFIFGCGDRSHLDILHGAGAGLGENTVHTELPPEVWETIRLYREADVMSMEISDPEGWNIDYDEEYARRLVEAAELKERQEAYYNRYIGADGIAIVGNDHTPDKYFVAAKNIILIMTSKHPELRNQLRGLWYFEIFGGGSGLPVQPPSADKFYSFAVGMCASKFQIQDGRRVWQQPPMRGLVEIGWCAALICECWPESPMSTFIHEVAHALHERVSDLDPTFDPPGTNKPSKLKEAYRTAIENRTWGSYRRHYGEYWADMVETWFLEIGDGYTQEFETYEDFAARDPLAYELLDEWFPKVSFYEIY